MKLKLALAVAAFASTALASGLASAYTITFEGDDGGFYNSATNLAEGPYTVTYTPASGAYLEFGAPVSCGPACSSDGTVAAYSFNTGTLSIAATSGADFSLTTLDAAQTFTMSSRPLALEVTGFLAGGGTITDLITVPAGGADNFSTYSLPSGFNDISSVSIAGTGTYPTTEFALDNIVLSDPVSAAPEPSIWALMMLGVGGVGLMLRQAKTSGYKSNDTLGA